MRNSFVADAVPDTDQGAARHSAKSVAPATKRVTSPGALSAKERNRQAARQEAEAEAEVLTEIKAVAQKTTATQTHLKLLPKLSSEKKEINTLRNARP